MTRSKIVQQFGWSFCFLVAKYLLFTFEKIAKHNFSKVNKQNGPLQKTLKKNLNHWRIAQILMQGF